MDPDANSGASARPGQGETEEVAKSSLSTEGQNGVNALCLVCTFPNPMGHEGQVQFFGPVSELHQLTGQPTLERAIATLMTQKVA